ncbi:tetratricopeptide repeat protein [Streptomyces liangshanensis]|uniref:Tetratricopeptide repeat protein n=1 Tax=Streptomyces liangshanensis TaxID=2717324 RepID=A0A6G9H6X2_9ACTN|nr:tetratricopeptide repeat protein [Streptomyces liangshanensis]QIQ06283.1 tetratricopeptide repeat protein [Streptomyces liangshanensis]
MSVHGMSFHEQARDAFRRGDTAVVERLSRHELDRAREAGDAAGQVDALCMLARVQVRGGDLAEAGRWAAQAREVADGSGDKRLGSGPAHILAGVATMSGELETARVLIGESVTLHQELGDARMVAVEHHNLGYVELRLGRPDRARELFAEVRARALAEDWSDMLPYVTADAAVIADADGDHARSARLLGAAAGAYRAAGQIPDPDDAVEQDALRERLIGALGADVFDVEYTAGAAQDARRALALLAV